MNGKGAIFIDSLIVGTYQLEITNPDYMMLPKQ